MNPQLHLATILHNRDAPMRLNEIAIVYSEACFRLYNFHGYIGNLVVCCLLSYATLIRGLRLQQSKCSPLLQVTL